MSDIAGKLSEELRKAYALAVASLGARPEVTGVDIGYKYRDKERQPDLVLRVHVNRKKPQDSLQQSERIPKLIAGIPTDVIEGRYRKQSNGAAPLPWERHDVVRPGISAGNPTAETGTIGLIVTDDDTGALCLLSAGHVFAGLWGADHDPITQPARLDFGVAPADSVAELYRWHAAGPWGDAAIARLNNRRRCALEQATSGVTITAIDTPAIGQILEKAARTTKVTRGCVEGMGTYYYPDAPGGVSGFMLGTVGVDDPNSQDLSAPGDSGAVWYDPDTRTGIGLHVAGEAQQANEFAIACYLTRVMTTLRVSLTTRLDPPPGT